MVTQLGQYRSTMDGSFRNSLLLSTPTGPLRTRSSMGIVSHLTQSSLISPVPCMSLCAKGAVGGGNVNREVASACISQ